MKTASDPRHQRRQKIVQDLFSWDAHQKISPPKNLNLSQTSNDIIAHLDLIDRLIKKSATERDIVQINQVDKAILRLAIYEILFTNDTPTKVLIDEAVELAKEFGGENSPQFVNGVLGNVLTDPDRIFWMLSVLSSKNYENITLETRLTTDLGLSSDKIKLLVEKLQEESDSTKASYNEPLTVTDLIKCLANQS